MILLALLIVAPLTTFAGLYLVLCSVSGIDPRPWRRP